MSANISYDPRSENYWGRKMYPGELEDKRNEMLKDLYKNVRRHLSNKIFRELRSKSMDLVNWKTAEERLNEAYKAKGFWKYPKRNFWAKRYTDKSKIQGLYNVPFSIIENEDFKKFSKNQQLLLNKMKRVNKNYSIPELTKEIKKLKFEIENLVEKISSTWDIYSRELQHVISSCSEVENYEKNTNDPFGRNETISNCEVFYYGAVFGNEHAIYEYITNWVDDDKIKEHIELLTTLRELSKKYLVYQITKAHYDRGPYGGWDRSVDLVKEILEKIGSIESISDEAVIRIIKEYLPNYEGPGGKGAKLVRLDYPNNHSLVKSSVSKAISEILKKNEISLGERHIRDKINADNFNPNCRYWK